MRVVLFFFAADLSPEEKIERLLLILPAGGFVGGIAAFLHHRILGI